MHIERLLIQNLRIFEQAQIHLEPRWNVFTGANGSGKTSLLEAVHLLSFGRSFRTGAREALIRLGQDRTSVYAEILAMDGLHHRLGLERAGQKWTGRIDQTDISQLSELYRQCPVTCFEPGSHNLISGDSQARRSLLDWGVFHVEPEFLLLWRRYQRALKQRNALIKDQAPDDWFPPWEQEMAESGQIVAEMRARYSQGLGQQIEHTAVRLVPELGAAKLLWKDGWKGETPQTVPEASQHLAKERIKDRQRGFTRRGPHRADWEVTYPGAPQREHLSRGQEKLTALIVILSLTQCFHLRRGEWPILLLDDLASELDTAHLNLVLNWLNTISAQIWITGVTWPEHPAEGSICPALFHVERGRIHRHR